MESSARSLIALKLASSALLSVAALMALPPHRLWAVASCLMFAAALTSINKRSNRWLLGAAFMAAAIYGAVVGQLFWQGSQLTDTGLLLLLPLGLGVLIVLLRVFMVERDAA